jgi:hypothetical protein
MTTGLVADFARTEVCLCIIQLTGVVCEAFIRLALGAAATWPVVARPFNYQDRRGEDAYAQTKKNEA